MEKLIKKFKKLVKEENNLTLSDELEQDIKSDSSPNNSHKNNHFEESSDINDYMQDKKFQDNFNKFESMNDEGNKIHKFDFANSEFFTKSERIKMNKKLTKSLSENHSNKFGNNNTFSAPKQKSSTKKLQNDKLTKLITNCINYIQKNKDNISLNKVLDNLNEILEEHISNLSELKLNSDKESQQKIVMQTKYETAEKMMKNFELKFLTSEKEKNKLIKQINDMTNQNLKLTESTKKFQQNESEINMINKNNKILIDMNEELKKVNSDLIIKGDFIKKKYEEDISEIKYLLSAYKEKLEKIENKLYLKNNPNNNSSRILDNSKEDKTMTLNSIQ